MMNIDEFLINNPTFNETDVNFLKTDGIYDENALKAFDKNINVGKREALTGEYSPILKPSTRTMIQSSKQSSLISGLR